MKLCTSMLAASAMLALAMVGCEDTQSGAQHTPGPKGSISAALTLPDDSEITSVSWTLTGPLSYSATGSVPVGNSTTIAFQIPAPAGVGYVMALSATTSHGNSCAGSSMPFDVLVNQTSRVQIVLTCGATDPNGTVLVEADVSSCPVITALSAIPLETRVGTTLELSSAISHGDLPVQWSGSGGTFSAADAYATSYTCGSEGTHTLTVAVNGGGCSDAVDVEVSCSAALVYVPFCRNGTTDTVTGEECDDNNAVNDDACSNACTENICGNSRIDAGEACDGGPDCSATCTLLGCGDSVVSGTEECDDGNVVDADACSNMCLANICGNSRIDAGETCDDGNTVAGDTCSPTCQTSAIDTCTPCRNTYCTDYQGSGVNLVAGCFETIQPGFDIAEPDPLFIQHCTEAVECASMNDCGYNLARGPVECYCGSRSTDDCQAMGPGPDAACVSAWTDATRGATNAAILDLFSDFSRPSGWAFYMLTCDATNCDDAPAGDCTPN